MTTANLTNKTSAQIAAVALINAHFQYSGTVYQKNNGDADPQALAVILALGVSGIRERLSHGVGAQTQALDALTGMKLYGHAGDVNSTEAEVRAAIHAYAIDTGRRDQIAAITGVNEPNNRTSGSGPTWTGAGTWQAQVVAQQFWIKDQVEIEDAAGNWTGGKPLIVGPGLKHEHVPYDADIAALAAATYITAGITYHMADLCDVGDFHYYSGFEGPGHRMNGEDDLGDVPPGITLSSIDGKVSQEEFELRRASQVFDSMLTGGAGALVSGHWKYTGGTITPNHGDTFVMCHSEGGTPIDEESGHTADEWQAKAAIYVPEMVLRDLAYGVTFSIPYQALTDRKTDGLRLGMYNLSQYPTGALPPYTALKTMVSYAGSTTFVGIGAWLDIGGHLPDCKGYAVSVSATEWWLYVLREADTVAHLQLDAAYKVEGVSISGDGTYHLDLSDSLTIWHVVATGGGGGAPVWTDTTVGNSLVGAAYTFSVAATGATSYSILSGTIPTGAAFNTATGAFTGTVTTAGDYTFVIRATNGSGHSDSPPITSTVSSTPVFTADSPPLTGTVGTAYTYTFAASGFRAPTFTQGGSAVPGVTMSTDGTFDGTPTTAGNYTMHAVAATSLFSSVNGGNHTIVISAGGGGSPAIPVFSVPPPPPDDGIVGTAMDYRFRADDPNGVEDPTFSVASGTIPLGCVLTVGGHLKSKPTVPGAYTFSVAATNSAGTATTADLTINVVDNGDHGAGQTITYALAGPNSAISHHVQFQGSTLGDKKSARFDVVQDVNGNAQFVVRVKQSGKLDIDDVNGVSLAKGESFFALFGTGPETRWRASYVVGFTGTKATLLLKPYGDLESTQASDTLYAEIATTIPPYQIEIGNKTGEVYVTTDPVQTSPFPSEIPPDAPGDSGALAHLFTLTGGATASSFMANSRMTPGSAAKSVDLVYSTSADLSSPSLAGSVTVNADQMAKHAPFGLTADTWYYAKLKDPVSGNMVGEPFKCKTQPASTGAWTRKIAVVSCQNNPQQGAIPQLAWRDILAWGPDEEWHLGDWGYWGGTIKASEPYTHDIQKYDKVAAQVPSQRAAQHAAGTQVVCISDHELHDNGDDWDGHGTEDPTGAFNCPHAIRQQTAHEALFPIRTYGDVRAPKRGRYYSYDMGSSVRVIVTDFRSPDRNNAADANTSAKQMWGAVQEAWLFAQLDQTKVNIIVNETSNWFDVGGLRATDKPAAYPDAQIRLNDKINGTGDFAGGPVYSVLWVGGDRHYCGFLAGENNTFGGFPEVISSGLFKNALQLQNNELVDWITLNPDNTDDKFAVCQYVQMTLSFDGTDTVTMTCNARVANTVREVTDGVTTNNSLSITSGTAAFTASDVGMLIAGDGIRTGTTIAAVADSTHATMSKTASSTQAAGAWTIQNPQNVWQMSDFPGGSLTTVSWTEAGGAGTPFLPDWI